MAGRPQCRFVRPDGSTCGATATSTGICYFHDPRYAEKRAEARKKGGEETRQRRRKIAIPTTTDLPLSSVEEVAAALALTFNQIRRGELDVRVGNCLGLLAGTLIRCYRREDEMTLHVKPAGPSIPQLTEEVKQRLLAEVKQRQASRALIGVKELPLPAPNGSQTKGESLSHAE